MSVHAEASRLFARNQSGGAGLGNNIYPAIPQLGQVMAGPTVRGALTSICGPDYSMNAHRYMHNSTSQGDQTFHKDGAYRPTVNLRPRVVMVLFAAVAGAILTSRPCMCISLLVLQTE
jgi:hypothetical protein